MIDEFLSKFNIKYEQLNEAEKETLTGWLENLSKTQISVEEIKNYVRKMADGVAKELAVDELPRNKDIFLKARLRNYLLLYDFLIAPQEARNSLEKYMHKIK